MTTLWRPIPGFTGCYASLDGDIYDVRYMRRRKPCIDPAGYARLSLVGNDGKSHPMYVHALVMLAYRGPRPDGLEVLHENDNGADNRLVNLSYGTHKENMATGWRRRGLKDAVVIS